MENNEKLITACIKDENNNVKAKCCFFNNIEELIKEIDDYISNELALKNSEVYIDSQEIFSEDEKKTLTDKGYHFY